MKIGLVALMAAALVVPASGQRMQDFTIPQPMPPGSCLVIGILGGINRWNDALWPVRTLALDLRASALPQVYVETVENRHQKRALELIRRSLDTNRDGRLDAAERSHACVILYGQSLGGMAVLKLAREMQRLQIPVRLAIEIDSIGAGSHKVPANVMRVANLYQRSAMLLRGHSDLPLEDPARTQIIANRQFDYSQRQVDVPNINPVERTLGGKHITMEFDPEVWKSVRALIVEEVRRGREQPSR
jgi:hypothetical protein